jgi:hypothetical protein
MVLLNAGGSEAGALATGEQEVLVEAVTWYADQSDDFRGEGERFAREAIHDLQTLGTNPDLDLNGLLGKESFELALGISDTLGMGAPLGFPVGDNAFALGICSLTGCFL